MSWFEIPVINFDKALKFYEEVFQIKMHEMQINGINGQWGFFPFDPTEGGIGGGIVKSNGYVPSQKGTLVYLNGGDDLSVPLMRIEKAGGKIILAKTPIGENGFMALFMDTEGNKVGLHSTS